MLALAAAARKEPEASARQARAAEADAAPTEFVPDEGLAKEAEQASRGLKRFWAALQDVAALAGLLADRLRAAAAEEHPPAIGQLTAAVEAAAISAPGKGVV